MFMCACSPSEQNPRVMIGSYADSNSLKIYDFDQASGCVKNPLEIPVAFSSFAAVSDAGIIYAVTETGPEDASVSAFRLQGDSCVLINREKVHGNSPCHIALTPDGRFVATANYGDGTVSVFPVLPGGALGPMCQQLQFEGNGPVERRQAGSHPHFIHFSNDGNTMYVNDLGADCIHSAGLTGDPGQPLIHHPERDIRLKAGTGPRHIVYDSSAARAYLINEISDEVLLLSVSDSALVAREYFSSPMGGGHGAGDIQLSADGSHLYASLRLQNDGISMFDVDPASGELTFRAHTPTGTHPRTFTLSPDGRWLLAACRDAGAVEIYSVAPDGSLQFHRAIDCPKAAFVRFI